MLLGPILILLTLAGCASFVFRPVWFPLPVSSEAILFDRQFGWTLWIAGAIFVVLQLLLAFVILRSARQRSARAGSLWLELGWTAAAAALFVTLALGGSRTWAKVPAKPGDIETIEVYSHQFAWHFRYPGADGKFGVTNPKFINDSAQNSFGIDPADKAGRDDIVTASLRIPVGRDVLLLLHSRDVIHDFFVRELRTKQDIVPGMEIPLQIRVDREGQYEIACAELCGLGHSQMRSVLIAMPPDAYDRWKASQQEQQR